MTTYQYFINKAKQLIKKAKNKMGVVSPSSIFSNIGVFICYGIKAGEQAARLDELHRKLYEPYRLPRSVYAREYGALNEILLDFKYAQFCYEND